MIISKYIPLSENIRRLNEFNDNILYPILYKTKDRRSYIKILDKFKSIIIGEMYQKCTDNYYTKREATKYFNNVKDHDDNKESYIDHLNYIFNERNTLFLPFDLKIQSLQMKSVFLCNKIYDTDTNECNVIDMCYANLEYEYSIHNVAYKIIKYYNDVMLACNFKFNFDELDLKFSYIVNDLERTCKNYINDLTQLSILTENKDIKDRSKLLVISQNVLSIKDDLYDHNFYSLKTHKFETINSKLHHNIYDNISSDYYDILSKYLDDETTKLKNTLNALIKNADSDDTGAFKFILDHYSKNRSSEFSAETVKIISKYVKHLTD